MRSKGQNIFFRTAIFFCFCLGMFLSSSSWAQQQRGGFFDVTSSRVGGYSLTFQGENNKYLGEESNTMGIEIENIYRNTWFGVDNKFRFGQAAGTASLLDNSTAVRVDYLLTTVETSLGFRLNLMKRRESGFNISIGASGLMSYNSIDYSSASTLNSFKSPESSTVFGSEALIGVEYLFGPMQGSRTNFGLYFDIGLRSLKTKFFNQEEFSLGGMFMSAGLTW